MLKRVTWSLHSALIAGALAVAGAPAEAQRLTCPPAGWSLTRLDALKRDGFKMPDAFQRHELAIALTGCLGEAKPEIRDGIAFEALS